VSPTEHTTIVADTVVCSYADRDERLSLDVGEFILEWAQVYLYTVWKRRSPMLKEILVRILIALGLIAFIVLRALNNVFRRS